MNEELNQSSELEQGAEQQQESVDPIVLLGQELQQIREALGLGESPASSSLMQRLNSIESKLAQPERERNLPQSITWEQAGSLSFMRKSGIRLEDINSGRVQVTRD